MTTNPLREPNRAGGPPCDFGDLFYLRNIDWDSFETILDLVGDQPVQVAYIDGDVELGKVSFAHETRLERPRHICHGGRRGLPNRLRLRGPGGFQEKGDE